MTGRHNLNAPAFGLALDQIHQEAESRRMNPIFQLLDEVERGRGGTEQGREDARNRSVPSEALRAEMFRPFFSFNLSRIRPAAS